MKSYIVSTTEKNLYPNCWKIKSTFDDEEYEQERETIMLDEALDPVKIIYNAYEDTLTLETEDYTEVHLSEKQLKNMLLFIKESKKANKRFKQ